MEILYRLIVWTDNMKKIFKNKKYGMLRVFDVLFLCVSSIPPFRVLYIVHEYLLVLMMDGYHDVPRLLRSVS